MAGNRRTQRIPEGFTPGDQIPISSWEHHSIAVTPSGDATYYLGFRCDDQPHDIACYEVSVAVRDSVSRGARQFVRLSDGTLTLDSFLSSYEHYKILDDRIVSFPTGADTYFGVLEAKTRTEDVDLTRQLFGATYGELQQVVSRFGELTGRVRNEYLEAGRVTFSRTRNNSCDICGCMIPREFPYLAFEQAQYDWSHVSLYGFYRLLAFLCSNRRESPIQRGLVDLGVEREVVERLIRCGNQHHEPLCSA